MYYYTVALLLLVMLASNEPFPPFIFFSVCMARTEGWKIVYTYKFRLHV